MKHEVFNVALARGGDVLGEAAGHGCWKRRTMCRDRRRASI